MTLPRMLSTRASRTCSLRRTLASLAISIPALPAIAQNQLWVRQLGTSAQDDVRASAPDGSGGVYVCGATWGALGGPYAGNGDAWMARYDSAGAQLWIRQLGTPFEDWGTAAATDGSGGVYVGGWTFGSLGGPSAGSRDAWLARYDSAGSQLWVRQLGTANGEVAAGMSPDASGGVYVTGYTAGSLWGPSFGGVDVWLARYDSAGNQLWIDQFGTSSGEEARAATPDGSGGVYVCGNTAGNLGASNAGSGDPWLARYDSAGNQLWVRQFGSSAPEYAQAAAPDGSGGVYMGGATWGNLAATHAGAEDAWLARYDGSGNQLWVRQLGTSAADLASACAPAAVGGVFLTGWTNGRLGGTKIGGTDSWLARYDGAGNQDWIQQVGTYDTDYGWAAAPDASGGVYMGGLTSGNFRGPKAGGGDAWLARYEAHCTAGPVYCTAKTNSAGCVPAISATGNPSASAGSGLTIRTIKLLDNKFGLYFYSKTGPSSMPFQGGFLCTQTPLVRTALQNSGGFAPCGGLFKIDFNAYVASGKDPALVAGQQVSMQTWSRDPGFAPPNNTSLSDAVSFTLCP